MILPSALSSRCCYVHFTDKETPRELPVAQAPHLASRRKGGKLVSLIPKPAPFLPHQAPKDVQNVLARMMWFGGESEPRGRKPPQMPPGPTLCYQSEGREGRRGTAAGLSERGRGGDHGQNRVPARPRGSLPAWAGAQVLSPARSDSFFPGSYHASASASVKMQRSVFCYSVYTREAVTCSKLFASALPSSRFPTNLGLAT